MAALNRKMQHISYNNSNKTRISENSSPEDMALAKHDKNVTGKTQAASKPSYKDARKEGKAVIIEILRVEQEYMYVYLLKHKQIQEQSHFQHYFIHKDLWVTAVLHEDGEEGVDDHHHKLNKICMYGNLNPHMQLLANWNTRGFKRTTRS